MAIAIVSSEVKTSSGNLTIPANCNFIVALVLGTTNPTIATIAMTQDCSDGVSISHKANPPTGTVACTVGDSTRFVYLSGAGSVRAGATAGSGVPPTYSTTIDTSASDIVFGVSSPVITSMTGGGSAMTYLDNYMRGYKAGSGATMNCVATTVGFGGIFGAFASMIESASGPANVKKVSSVAVASIKKISGVALADIKKVSGVG